MSLRSTGSKAPQPSANTRRRALSAALALLLLAGASYGAFYWVTAAGEAPEDDAAALVEPCEVPPEVLRRVWRGYVPRRSGDVLMIERLPHQFGDRHSTPWPYTQDVPLVFYGPGFIRRGGGSNGPATVADMAPTYAELLGYGLRGRDGKVLDDALLPKNKRNGIPKLIITVVWDGGGDNVLRRWPDAWPTLKRLMQRGSDFSAATVGSSPSITPAVHATIGTGSFPKKHGIPDIKMRVKGRITDAYERSSPKFLRAETLADAYDRDHGNASLIGMLARDSWHLGMIGHGSFLEGADKDIAVLDDLGGISFRTNTDYYSLPQYMMSTEGLERAVREVDARDGKEDRQWLGNALVPFAASVRYTPAFSIYQTQRIVQLLRNEGFGADDIPDLFYTNYKAPDLAGHEWNMEEPEVRDNIAEADRQLRVLIRALDDIVGKREWVMGITADHGQTPYPEVRNAWSINQRELGEDIAAAFDRKSPNTPLITANRGYQLMLDNKELQRNDVTPAQVADFVRNYRLRDNAEGGVPAKFQDRADERLYLAAFTPDRLRDALDCSQRRAQLERARAKRSLATRAKKSGLPTT